MRVALLSPCYWPEVQRGSERIIRDLATDLIAGGHQPTLVTSHPGRPSDTVEDGLRVVRHWRPPEAPLLRLGHQAYTTHLPFTRATLRTGEFDVAHAFYLTDAYAGVRSSRRTGRPTVFTLGGIPSRPALASRRGQMRMLREVLDAADAFVAYSDAAARAAERWLGVRPTPIHPGVRLESFPMGSERSEEPTIACAAAADDPRKRVDLLVRAFARVRRARPGARLAIVQPADPRVAEQLRRAGDGIELWAREPDAVAREFGRAWVSALPSLAEAFGLVVVESLACGTPAVGSGDAGIAEILDRPEVGRLFEGGEDELARALLEALELAEDDGTRERCRARAADFSTTRAAGAHVELYEGLARRAT